MDTLGMISTTLPGRVDLTPEPYEHLMLLRSISERVVNI